MALAPRSAMAQRVSDLANLPDPTADLYPAKRNEKYALDRPITDEKINAHYNNFYEFNSSKEVSEQAQKLTVRPWTIKIDGMVEKPMEVGIDDLVAQADLEERTYRHRCVEAWSMAIAWTGFPLAKLVDFARPSVRRNTSRCKPSKNTKEGPGSGRPGTRGPISKASPWRRRPTNSPPRHRRYGHSLAKQHGAPLRLAVPWKYGFKSIKSIVRFTFTDKRPKGSGRRCSRPNTASGPTSIRRCRIRAGARRAEEVIAPASGGRR